MPDFNSAVERVLAWEGGFSNDPADLGGATQYGITLRELERWRERPQSIDDIKSLTRDEAKLIYRANYWLPLSCDKMKSGAIASAVFDQGVNCGVGTSAMRLQKIVGVAQDGKVGPVTLAKLNAADERKIGFAFAKASCENYAAIVTRKPSQAAFILGWIRRGTGLYDLFI